jgi:hypothetical protein
MLDLTISGTILHEHIIGFDESGKFIPEAKNKSFPFFVPQTPEKDKAKVADVTNPTYKKAQDELLGGVV